MTCRLLQSSGMPSCWPDGAGFAGVSCAYVVPVTINSAPTQRMALCTKRKIWPIGSILEGSVWVAAIIRRRLCGQLVPFSNLPAVLGSVKELRLRPLRTAHELHFPPAFHGFEHGDFVGVFNVAAYRNSHGDPGYAQSLPLQLLGQVGGGGFSLDRGVGGEDDFFDFATADPADQV